jgi:hypothetical protein
VLRLAQPALPLFLFYVAVIGGARLVGVPKELLDVVIVGAGLPLWFLAAYTLCQAVVSLMAGLHTRAPIRTLLVLLACALVVDTIRFADGWFTARAVAFLVGSRLMTIYLWHLPVIIALSGILLLIPGAAPQPATPLWWWTRPLAYVLVLLAVFGLSFVVGRWEAPREVGGTPPTWIVAVSVALTFVPAYCVLQWGLDFPLAILGALFFGGAVMLLGRWPASQRREPAVSSISP